MFEMATQTTVMAEIATQCTPRGGEDEPSPIPKTEVGVDKDDDAAEIAALEAELAEVQAATDVAANHVQRRAQMPESASLREAIPHAGTSLPPVATLPQQACTPAPPLHALHGRPPAPQRQLARSATLPVLVTPSVASQARASVAVEPLKLPAPDSSDVRKQFRQAGREYTPRAACVPSTASPRVAASPRAAAASSRSMKSVMMAPLPPASAPLSARDAAQRELGKQQTQPASHLRTAGHTAMAVGGMQVAAMQDARNLAMIFPEVTDASASLSAPAAAPASTHPVVPAVAASRPPDLHPVVPASTTPSAAPLPSAQAVLPSQPLQPPQPPSQPPSHPPLQPPALLAAGPFDTLLPSAPPPQTSAAVGAASEQEPLAPAIALRLDGGGAMPDGAHVDKLGTYVQLDEGIPDSGDPLVNGRHCYARAEDPRLMMWWASGRWWVGKRSELGMPRGWIKASSNESEPPQRGWHVLSAKIKPVTWKEAVQLSCQSISDPASR
jgi:hypothetical protein